MSEAAEVPSHESSMAEVAATEDDEEASGAAPSRKQNQARQLIDLARQGAELWKTSKKGETFATVLVDGHREHLPLAGLRDWLRREFFQRYGRPPSTQPLKDALAMLNALAGAEGEVYPVFVRVGQGDGTVWIDLCDHEWQAVEITAAGWRVVANPPVRFRRSPGMLPLPTPVAGGEVDELRTLLPWLDDETWTLVVSWLVGALAPRGPYPVLVLQGEQGSGKSFLCRMLRDLVDPSEAALLPVPREERDLAVAVNNTWIFALDNLSGMPKWLSDALCRVATGTSWRTRRLYTDLEEVLIRAGRPILANGIDEIISPARDDLRDRALVLHLPPIPADCRRPEQELLVDFERLRPRVFGALLNAVSMALRRRASVELPPPPPRMMDFAIWVSAAEPALGWPDGHFVAVYGANRRDAASASLESNPIAQLILALLEKLAHPEWGTPRDSWQGTTTELLRRLEAEADDRLTKGRSWPTTPRALASQLRRAAPLLREAGVEIGWRREGHDRRRLVIIERVENRPSAPSASSAANTETALGADANGLGADANVLGADANVLGANADSEYPADGADGADAKIPTGSLNQLLSLAEAAGWPPVLLRPGVSVGPGEVAWRRFIGTTSADRRQQALAALGALSGKVSPPRCDRCGQEAVESELVKSRWRCRRCDHYLPGGE